MDNTDITTNKIDDNTIEVVQTVTSAPVVTTQTYQLDFLLSQRDSIQNSKDDFDALRDAELLNVNNLIDECKKLGIVISVEPIIN